ncbi:MAG TPA: taurine catabolism dioxygenase TauD [Rhodobacteraceae bacterium]|nr:taurine catabolism dioxygenase TauD [Paracoccaceae bacterium]
MRENNGFFWKTPKVDDFYREWRAARFLAAEAARSAGFVEIANLANPSEAEKTELIRRCTAANLALYATDDSADQRGGLRPFAEAFELRIAEKHRSAGGDGIVALRQSDAPGQKGYIPYSKRKMNWHTDGYYNAPDDRISAMVLHTERPADDGGSNQFLDHTIAFIRLMDENPDYVAALMHPQAMTIPANEEEGSIRPASVGPVFFPDADTGEMQMRYTARTRSIEWRDTSLTRDAVAFLQHILETPDPMTISLRFGAGQGVLCNNVLHDRTGFDAKAAAHSPRTVYRIRFHNRVKGMT